MTFLTLKLSKSDDSHSLSIFKPHRALNTDIIMRTLFFDTWKQILSIHLSRALN